MRWFKAIGFWISITLSVVVLVLYVLSRPTFNPEGKPLLFGLGDMLEILEAKYLDVRFALRGVKQPTDKVVIVAIDEKTYDALGRWQTSGRRWIAKMLDVLRQAKVVGFDVTFAEPDEGAAMVAVDEIKTRLLENLQGQNSNYEQLLPYLEEVKANHDYDSQLAEAIRQHGNVILGIYHFADRKSAAHITPEQRETSDQLIRKTRFKLIMFAKSARAPLAIERSFGVELNLPGLSDAAKSFGHFNVQQERDGYVRKSLLVMEYEGGYYPSLDLEIVKAYLNPPLPSQIFAWEESGLGKIDSIQVGDLTIPTDEKGRLLINYYGPGYTFPHYSLADVVLGKISPDTFKDKIVLVGFTAAIAQDLHSTSFEPGSYPGVEIHATIIENILHQDFLIQPDATIIIDGAILLLLGVLLGLILHQTRPFSGILMALICLMSVAAIVYAAFRFERVWLNVTFPVFFIILDYVAITSYKYFTEERRKKEVRNAFQHYVAPVVVEQMLDKVDQLHLGGERKQLTAFFSDIRGFTSISEKMDPETLVKFLNEYLTAMTRIVLKYEGTVDKYMGDAIMAFYGAPLEQPDHAVRACKSAVEMIARLKELRQDWEARGFPPMNIGIGINSGDMSVGNMGSEERFDYTIMGDNVNLASRLEGINKQYGTNIVISQFTCDLIRRDNAFIVRELDSVRVKGKREPVTIYELMGYGSRDRRISNLLKTFNDGLNAYKNRQWEQAIASFREALRVAPEDESSKLYLERCQEYQQSPPPEDWDGVLEMETK